jgi:hypothetical protein
VSGDMLAALRTAIRAIHRFGWPATIETKLPSARCADIGKDRFIRESQFYCSLNHCSYSMLIIGLETNFMREIHFHENHV